jgi:hypothetical protein
MAPPDAFKDLGYIRLSEHAKEKLEGLDGVTEDLVVGRVDHCHGRLHYEFDNRGRKWELYDPEENVAIRLTTEPEMAHTSALVTTVFEVSNQHVRYYEKGRFSRWWT